MSNIPTTTNSSPNQPLPKEGKAVSAPVLNNQENLEGIDRAGWFDEEAPSERSFDANSGGQIIFNIAKPSEDKAVSASSASDLFKEGAFVTLGAAKSGAGAIGNIFKDTLGAVTDIVKNDIAFETPKEQSPEKQAEEEKKAVEVQYKNQVMENTDSEIASVRAKIENMARLNPMKQEISDLTGLQAMLSGKDRLVDESGQIRADLQDDVEYARKQIMRAQQGQSNDLSISSKQKQGIDMRADHVEQQGATAQTAVG